MNKHTHYTGNILLHIICTSYLQKLFDPFNIMMEPHKYNSEGKHSIN